MLKLRSSVCVAVMTAGLALAGGAAASTTQTTRGASIDRAGRHALADTIIWPRATLFRNQAWTSGNGRAILRLQSDGNLVLYKDGRPAWQAPNTWSRGASAVFQEDGNFVVYNGGGGPVWASGTWRRGSYLAVQDDGNLVIYNGNHNPVWATNTGD